MLSDSMPPPTQQVMQLMQQQLQLVDGYIDYLDQIKQSVSGNDIDRLNELLADKSPNLRQIEQIQQQQGELLGSMGYSNDPQGLDTFISDHDLPALTQIKQALGERVKQLEKSLLINDLLIRKNQSRVRQSIRLLSGHGNSPIGGTYSRAGNTEDNQDTQRTLGQV